MIIELENCILRCILSLILVEPKSEASLPYKSLKAQIYLDKSLSNMEFIDIIRLKEFKIDYCIIGDIDYHDCVLYVTRKHGKPIKISIYNENNECIYILKDKIKNIIKEDNYNE